MASDLREDLVTGARVIVAPGRSVRPDTFRSAAPSLPPSVQDCPFCAGNEHDTPPEVARRGPGEPDTPGWRVRVVPNKYPIAGASANGTGATGTGPTGTGTTGTGVSGAHEVVVLSPAHDRSLADLDDAAIIEVFGVMRDRVGKQLADGHTYADTFVNHGKPAGASIEHPHAQVVALDFVPPFVDRILERFAEARRDLLHDAIDEARRGPFVLLDDEIVVWCPPASTGQYAVRCALPFGRQRFDFAADSEIAVTALGVGNVLRRLRAVLADVPYNLVVNTAPAGGDERPFHWWIDVAPRLTVTAGFEQATGLLVCTVAPEDAAAALRDA
jgi:UDPglucose--hexose-1-phosphate uridylyltransferase